MTTEHTLSAKNRVTAAEFAAGLDGRNYGEELKNGDAELARDNGLVVVFGKSVDLVEFRGAVYDELDAWEGTTVYLTASGIFESECNDKRCPYARRERAKCKTIKAVWHDDTLPFWTYETDIPHSTFTIYKDDRPYCRGIVFEFAALGD